MRALFHATACMCLFLLSHTALAENTNFTTSHFSGSGNCATCHDGLTDTSGENVSIVRDWGASMMANAAKDPLWRAKVATELERNPDLAPLIKDKCTKCHAPMANYEITKVQGGEVPLFGADGVLNPNHALYDAAMNGVSCTLCHQIENDATLGTLEGSSGHYNISQTKTIYGQFSDIFGQPMVNFTGYTPVYSEHVSDSALCATCHDLKTPYVDADGNVLTRTPESEFPEQMPYTEWENSIFADIGSNPTSCQDCHMPKTTSKVSNRPMWLGTKNGFAKHHLVGANTVMLTMLRDNAAQLDVTSTNLDLSIDRARTMLQSAATVEIVSASVNNGELEARVKVQNNSGHKAPTSYPSRRMWLHFKVTDSNDTVVFESGKINADGSITDVESDAGPVDCNVPPELQFESHYNEIERSDEVQIYETIMGDSDGCITYTLLRAAQYLKDNRLTPKGFDKLAVPSDVAVRGLAAGDADFNLGSDEVTYRFRVNVSGELNVSVSLNFQTIMHGYLQDLYMPQVDQPLPVQVVDFKTMYEAQSLKHETIASVQTTVVSDGGGTPPALPTVSLVASPSVIDAGQGQSSTLSWSSTDAASCTASGAWSGTRSATPGSENVSPGATSTYTLTCTGDGGSASDTVTVIVNEAPVPVPVVNLSASALTIDQGQTATLNWNPTDATSCTASDAWSGTRSATPDSSENVSPTVTSAYTLTCTGDGGTASESVTITVNTASAAVAPTVTLSASPSRVSRGRAITLSWSSTDATSCSASGNWSGAKPVVGSESIVINGPVTFTLNCSGDGGTASGSVSYGARGRRWLELR